MKVSFQLPYPPSVNLYWRFTGGRPLISREGRAYRRKVCSILARIGVEPMDGELAIEIVIYPPDRRRRDVDNVLKSLLDSLEKGGAYHNDSQIKRLLIERRQPVKHGHTTVKLQTYEGPQSCGA